MTHRILSVPVPVLGSLGVVLMALAASISLPSYGKQASKDCPEGAPAWVCTVRATPCHEEYVKYVCAVGVESAIAAANEDVIKMQRPVDENIIGTTCSKRASGEVGSGR